MDGVQLPQGLSHFEEAVYFLPLSSQKFLVLILSTSGGYFKDILKSEETASEWFSISFDKTLNKAVQWCEMDLVSCFWNSAANEFHVHFCNSML